MDNNPDAPYNEIEIEINDTIIIEIDGYIQGKPDYTKNDEKEFKENMRNKILSYIRNELNMDAEII